MALQPILSRIKIGNQKDNPMKPHTHHVLLLPLVMFALPVSMQAQFTFTTNNSTITITGYTGTNEAVTIPSSTNGLPVTSIGNNAFDGSTNLTSVMIPNSVTNIGDYAFTSCFGLTSITIPGSVASIGNFAFWNCSSLTNVTIANCVTSIGDHAFDSCGRLTTITIPNSVSFIGDAAFEYCGLTSLTIPSSVGSIGIDTFYGCFSLTSVTIPNSVNFIGSAAFYGCSVLRAVYFQGNAPYLDLHAFDLDNNAMGYYLPGTTGWDTFTGLPTALWVLPNPLILTRANGSSLGVQTNGFGFVSSWATNVPVVVEACTNLANPIWSPLRTNTLTSGSSYFSDPQWTNYPKRFYRIRLQ